MLKNITLSADEELIQKARERAQKENTSLNISFRQWLQQYVNSSTTPLDYDNFIQSLSYARSTRGFSRDEFNER
ncbi:MAG: hypothetical protein C4518_12455 [Desulfobacteraceae bacterium]|nr:MAG: hypothetical protein C4518_12455 [Desulfobacteraceae bacterium]